MNPKHVIPAVDKALSVLELLAQDRTASTSSEIARKLDIAPSTCYRILQTLVEHDWLRPSSGGRHEFSTGLLPLLRPLSDYQKLFDILAAPLEQIVQETGLTAKISVKQGDRALTVYRLESPRGYAPSSKVGASFPLAYGSSGSCLLAGMADHDVLSLFEDSPGEVWRLQSREDVWSRIREVREKGVCYDPGLFHRPVHGVSSPVYRQDGTVFSAITLVGWEDDFKGKNLAKMKKGVSDCALACSQALGMKVAA